MVVGSLDDPDVRVREAAATALGRLRDEDTTAALANALRDPSLWVRRSAASALGSIGSTRTVMDLVRGLSDSSAIVRASAALALGHVPSARSREALAQAAADPDAGVRWSAAKSLGEIGDVTALPMLRGLRGDMCVVLGRSVDDVAKAAMEAIRGRDRGLGSWWRRIGAHLRFRLGNKGRKS
jgi:HEAT repeat protein